MGDTIFHALRSRGERALKWIERDRARHRLLRMSDRALADMDLSRERLEAGAGAWPWRVADDTAETIGAIRAARARRSAAPNVAGRSDVPARRAHADLDAVRAKASLASNESRDATEERLAA